ncbi:hypothetical protein Q5762_32810 [Streptomyces sp. P9(2023)]|uniref:hypothetical protein n=1 Tax=Streptomyces sp. P9(2023) TaxID=3064394 RepID=UPI0028F40577|nr:hypothetical protein [Streptomyces sp. P9(2023)]MDT9693022.1 hypothetical protein [Streptomyces sp. P9(2023)]
MSGDNNTYYGDAVIMHGGQDNVGINKNQYGSPALEQALVRVLERVGELRCGVPAEAQESLDGALPVLATDSGASPEARRSALEVIRAVAGTAGSIGQPLLDATRAALQLLGG